ncbi:MAG: DUF2892 domain-containing protein [Burkholderiales bacterium]
MNINEGSTDRVVRVIAGLLILSLTFYLESIVRWIGLFGFIPLLTGTLGTCPVYSLLGINNCGVRKKWQRNNDYAGAEPAFMRT